MRAGEGLLPAQARAATRPGSVAVVAGAGTGKTHMLSHRYLFHLEQGLDPLEIVAVTFTERAAAELRSRIRALVAAALPDRPEVPVALEAAQISTLHALAARICRDHPEAAGVPPDFAVLDELEGSLWLAEQLDEALAELPAEVFAELPYAEVRDALARLLADPLEAEAAFAHGPERWPERVAAARAEALKRLTGDPAWQAAAAVVRGARGADGDRAEVARAQAVSGLEALARGDPGAALEALDAVRLQGGRAAAWPDGELPRVKEALKVLREAARAASSDGMATLELGAVDERLAALLPRLREAFAAVRAGLGAEKRRRRVLDFADLEVHALRALEDAAVRAHYARRWKAVLVDEFQDTSPAQEQLLDRLAGGMTVTVVGDEKQSIYGFRGADVAVFRRYRERLRQRARDGGAEPGTDPGTDPESAGGDVVMDASFRAHGPLVDSLDRVFAPVLGELHQPLRAVRHEPPGEGPHVTAHVVEGRADRARLQVSEARLIGRLVKDLLDAGVPVWDAEAAATRAVRPGDIAVLTRTWQPLAVYGEILPALGVPAVHSGGGDLLATREAKDAMAVLRFVADPRDDLALAALLRSPFFAVDDPTLYRFARHLPVREGDVPAGPSGRRRHLPWWEALDAAQALPRELERARAGLRELLAARAWPPSRQLQLVDALTGYSAVLGGLPGAERRLADWSGVVAFVRELERGLGDAFSVVRRLRRLLRAGVEVPRPVLKAEGAVDLLTIHRAKGLEWPLVVVADLARGASRSRPRMLYQRDLGLAFRLQDDDGTTAEPALYRLLRRERVRREDEETRRVLYVALTRARDRLLLTAAAVKGGNWDVLAPGLDAAGVPVEATAHDPAQAAYPPPPEPDRSETASALAALDPARLGDYGAHVEPRRPVPGDGAGVRSGAAGWALALALLETVDDAWTPLAAALQASGSPAPALELLDAALTVGGRESGHRAALGWRRAGRTLVVVDVATPPAAYDAEVLRLDPSDPPQALAARVREALTAAG